MSLEQPNPAEKFSFRKALVLSEFSEIFSRLSEKQISGLEKLLGWREYTRREIEMLVSYKQAERSLAIFACQRSEKTRNLVDEAVKRNLNTATPAPTPSNFSASPVQKTPKIETA